MGYSKEIYAEAVAEMEKRKLLSEQELDQRRMILYAKSPRADRIERELVKISVAAGKAVLSGSDIKTQLEQLKQKSLALQNELDGILKSFDYPLNYLEPWYQCEKCRDTGYIDGKMCSCMKNLLRQTAYEQLNRISPLSLCSFESFSPDYYSQDTIAMAGRSTYDYMKAVLKYCKDYAKSFSEDSESLLFQGGTGLGKTHLSLSIAQSVIDKGYGVIYVSAPNILSRLETMQFGGRSFEKVNEEQLLNDCDLLIIDDLGTEFTTKFTVSTIYNIINTRLNSAKPTIISTNLQLKEMQTIYGTRMVSRIVGMLRKVDFYGSDIRQLKRMKRKNS